jgi:hypothetical protein
MTLRWPETVDEIIGADQAVALAYGTAAGGAIVAPMTNFGVRDRGACTVEVSSSVGMWRKLMRISAHPDVALAFHTRRHGRSDRPEYVLLQGSASLSGPVPDFPAAIGEVWQRAHGPLASGPLWNWWLRVHHLRVRIEVEVRRVVVWQSLECVGAPQVYGEQMHVTPPAAQRPPAKGPEPRMDPRRSAARVARLPHLLLGWIGADGYPYIVPVRVDDAEPDGIVLRTPEGLVPRASLRAGLTGHAFTKHVAGQRQRMHTGWMESEPAERRVVYAPHTVLGYRVPPTPVLSRVVVGYMARRGLVEGLHGGVLSRDGRLTAQV